MKITRPTNIALATCAAAAGVVQASAQETHHRLEAVNQSASALSPEALAFVAENDEAMTRMMAAMSITPTGDVDRDFIAMMIPHHRGAIDMARAVLRSSRNKAVRRLANEIIITQQDEIRAMQLAIANQRASAAPIRGEAGQDR
jgi:uncharacterized protein (DUF305 family)